MRGKLIRYGGMFIGVIAATLLARSVEAGLPSTVNAMAVGRLQSLSRSLTGARFGKGTILEAPTQRSVRHGKRFDREVTVYNAGNVIMRKTQISGTKADLDRLFAKITDGHRVGVTPATSDTAVIANSGRGPGYGTIELLGAHLSSTRQQGPQPKVSLVRRTSRGIVIESFSGPAVTFSSDTMARGGI